MAVIDVDGVRRECSLLLVEDAREGDYVIVHAGFCDFENRRKPRPWRPWRC